jgi:hypothetical protein
MAERRVIADREHGGEEHALTRELAPPDGVNATMNAVKAAQSETPRDRGVGQADRAELFVGYEPTLALSQAL